MPKQLTLFFPEEVQALPDNQQSPPPSIEGECTKCGKCCIFYECPALNTNNKHCRIWDCRPISCRFWPQNQFQICEVDCPGYAQTGL